MQTVIWMTGLNRLTKHGYLQTVRYQCLPKTVLVLTTTAADRGIVCATIRDLLTIHLGITIDARKEIVMAKPLVSDKLWTRVEPLLPKREPPGEKGGRPPFNDRATLTRILFVLKTDIPREDLLQEMNCGCGMTCWRRFRD